MDCLQNYADDQKYPVVYTTGKYNKNSQKCLCTRQFIFHGSVKFKRVSCQSDTLSKCLYIVHQACHAISMANYYQTIAYKCPCHVFW